MVKVKICGLTRPEDIEFIETFPVDFLGFIMYPPSPRYVGPKLKELLLAVKRAKKVVVFVNPSYDEVREALNCGADFIQLHGDEPWELAQKIGPSRVIKAIRVGDSIDPQSLTTWKGVFALLLDTYKPNLPGGTGETFDWHLAKKVVDSGFRVFLAGGLKPENIIEAIRIVKPYAIDISSGVEEKPGTKDQEKIKALFKNLEGGDPPLR